MNPTRFKTYALAKKTLQSKSKLDILLTAGENYASHSSNPPHFKSYIFFVVNYIVLLGVKLIEKAFHVDIKSKILKGVVTLAKV